MSDEHKRQVEENARRVARWLAGQESEFEQGVAENTLANAVGLTHEEVLEAVDHLEMREEVVRFPHQLATPPQTVLKPGRGWPEAKEEILGGGAGAA